MSKSAALSPLGLFNWDNTIFDLMEVPTALDKDLLIQNLLIETAELEVLYPNPTVFKNLVGLWSRKELEVWDKLYSTTQYEYNPIENYNRYETGTQSGGGSTTHTGTDTTTTTGAASGNDTVIKDYQEGGTQSDNRDIGKEEGGTQGESGSYGIDFGGTDEVAAERKNEHYIAGFDSTPSGQSDGLVKQTRDEEEGTTTTTYGKTEDGTNSKTITFGKTEDITDDITTTFGKTEYESDTRTFNNQNSGSSALQHGEIVTTENEGEHELHAHGNIGVTTTQEMIQQERRIDRFNMYDIIIENFKMRFCILVY